MRAFLVMCVLAAGACAPDTGRQRVEVTLEARGAGDAPFDVDGFTVTLERADVAVGPLYVCATAAADIELCDAALFEWLDPVVVDALDASPQTVGPMEGTTGTARTVSFDYGISWYPTASTPSSGVTALDGHSAVFVGQAVRGADRVDFEAYVDVRPLSRGLVAVAGRPATVDVRGGETLVVEIDAASLLAAVDFDALLAESAGAADPIVIEAGDAAHAGIVLRMTATAPARWSWRER